MNYHAGLLTRVWISDKEQLNKRFYGHNCLNCQISQSLDDFQAQTIPEVFKNFTRKLERESQIEAFFTKAVKILRQEIDYQSIFKEVQAIFGNLFLEYNDYVDTLIEKIRFYKTELSVYKDANKLKTLKNEDVDAIYKQIKKVYKVYQEEKIRRNLLKELKADQ